MEVQKRNNIKEPFKAYKLEAMVTKASEGLSQVSVSEVLMIAAAHRKNKMSTYDLQTTIIDAASSLISIERPNYQYLAARLLNQRIRKEVYGSYEPGTLLQTIQKNIKNGLYMNFLEYYTEDEINNFDKCIVHSRDNNFTYAGLKQLESKYLLKSKTSKSATATATLQETPQMMNMLIMMTIFKDEVNRTSLIKRGYLNLSMNYISLPTPVMNGARTTYAKYISCNLINLGDTKESLSEGLKQVLLCTASKSGIGLDASHIRGLGSKIGTSGLTHTGVLPILKAVEAATSAFTQISRGGSATINYNWFQYEIMDILEFKNVKGSAETRIRNSDHCITFSNLIIERAKDGKDITLFRGGHRVPEVQALNEALGTPEFDKLYEQACSTVKNENKTTVKASTLINLFLQERLETGRLYCTFAENAAKGPWIKPCTKTNLCCEILVEHNPLDTPQGNVGTCILAAVNLGTTPDDKVRDVAGFCVQFLEALIDSHDFEGNTWIEKSAKDSRTLGIGISNLAGWLAKNKLSYLTKEAKLSTSRIMEQFSYGLYETSIELARIKGPAKNINRTKYTQGWFQHDEYKHLDLGHVLDWKSLAKLQKKYGQRHCTLSAVAPVANSAKPSNSTSGIDFVRGLETKKEDKGIVTTLVPFIGHKQYYTTVHDIDFDNTKYFEFLEYIQAHVDQSMSTNEYTTIKDVTLSDLQTSFLQASKSLKTMYYNNSLTEKTQDGLPDEPETEGCESGGCSI